MRTPSASHLLLLAVATVAAEDVTEPLAPPSPPVEPCISSPPDQIDLDFLNDRRKLLHTNLGGQGPDTGVPESIRYVNVAKGHIYLSTQTLVDYANGLQASNAYVLGDTANVHYDIELTNLTTYVPKSTANNGLSGYFGAFNMMWNQSTRFQMQMRQSCCIDDLCAMYY